MKLIRYLLDFSKLRSKTSCNLYPGEMTSTWFKLGKIISTPYRPFSSASRGDMNATSSSGQIIWIDLEMTGLDPETDHILEAACVVTDNHMNVIAEGPNLIIHQPLEILNTMNDWCKTHHTQTGLFKESLASKISLIEAEDKLLKFVQQHTPPGKCPLAGNTVYMDKFFLLKYMPRFCEHLHYRILDVSSVKILAKSWYNLDPPNKMLRHRALDDIKESIQELVYYQKSIFLPPHHAAASNTSSQ